MAPSWFYFIAVLLLVATMLGLVVYAGTAAGQRGNQYALRVRCICRWLSPQIHMAVEFYLSPSSS